MFNLFLKIFVFVSPILFLPLSVPALATLQFHQFGYFGSSISLVQLQIFQYGVIILFISALFDKSKRIFQDKYLAALLFFYIVSIYVRPSTIKTFPIIMLGFLLFYLVSTYTKIKSIRSIFMVIAFVSLLNTIFSVLQVFNINWIYMPKEKEIFGLMSYKSQLGIYQALAIPICYCLNPFLSLIPILGLLLSKSATALIPAVIGMLYFFRKKLLRMEMPCAWMSFFILLTVFIVKSFHKLTLRFGAWKEAIKMGADNLLVGNGVGTFNYIDKPPAHPPIYVKYTDPYNLYLEIFYAIGIFGAVAFLLFIIDKFAGLENNNLITRGLASSCFILCLVGLGYSFMDYPRLAGTAIVLFGLLTAVKKEEQNVYQV